MVKKIQENLREVYSPQLLTNIGQPDIAIQPLRLWETSLFIRLRNEIESTAEHLVAKSGERKETIAHVLAKTLITRNRIQTLIARENGTFVGYLTLLFPKFARLKGNAYLSMSVKASHRGKGIGSKLLSAAEDFGRSRNVRRMELEVFGENERAIKLYKKFGYAVEGTRKNAVVTENGFDDLVFMAKFL
ncbi:MAG: GNAT family N-acetyltransferase [Patescibacteria group bacterium]